MSDQVTPMEDEIMEEFAEPSDQKDAKDAIAMLRLEVQSPQLSRRLQESNSAPTPCKPHENKLIKVYSGEELRIGRDDKCDVVVLDERVSKHHFRVYSVIYDEQELSKQPPLLFCEDLQSTNGTFVNDVMIGNINTEKNGYLLSDGDVIQIRPCWTFRFRQTTQVTHSDRIRLVRDLQYFDDRYTVSDRVLGRGLYGVVYLAQEVATKKQVACKIVDLKAAAQQFSFAPSHSQRFGSDQIQLAMMGRHKVLREIKILSQLSHPHIVDLRKAFCSDNTAYMITGLAAGGDLFSYLEAHDGHLDDWNARVISRQILLALEYLHARGIGHRDVKPENVLVTQTDFGGRVVLIDFGFANYVDAKTGRMMSLVGTEGCAAPEIWTNEGHTLAVDMWSLGVLVVRILTGLPMNPWVDPTQLRDTEIVDFFLVPGDTPSRKRWLEIPSRALHFIHKVLRIEPGMRISASEALSHQWYSMPLSEATALEEGYRRVIASWEAREACIDIVETLPTFAPTDRATSRAHHPKLPDASMSPYLGLERHLRQRMTQTRQDVLANLNESGSHFITDNSLPQAKPSTSVATQYSSILDVLTTQATDLFGMSQNLSLRYEGAGENTETTTTLSSANAYVPAFDGALDDSSLSSEAHNSL